MEETGKIKDLVIKAQNGENSAFADLYETLYKPVYRYIYLRTREKNIAEDIAQDTFIKFYSNLEKFENKKDSPLAFLFTVARNSIIDHYRKENRSTPTDEETLLKKVDKATQDDFLKKKENINLAELAMSLLEGDQKEAVMLKFISGMENEEIGKIINKSEEAVRQIQSRGIKKIKEYFKKNNIFE